MKLLEYINEISVGVGIIVFLYIIVSNVLKKKQNQLEDILVKVFSGSAIPTGLVLLLCGFKPNLINKLGGLNVHISVAGMALIYISIKGVFSDINDDGKNT